jgi:hypothetical protein
MSVCCECCVLSDRGLCDELLICPEESYWLWCVVVCDLETSWIRRPWPTGGRGGLRKKKGKKRYISLSCLLAEYFLVLAPICCYEQVWKN